VRMHHTTAASARQAHGQTGDCGTIVPGAITCLSGHVCKHARACTHTREDRAQAGARGAPGRGAIARGSRARADARRALGPPLARRCRRSGATLFPRAPACKRQDLHPPAATRHSCCQVPAARLCCAPERPGRAFAEASAIESLRAPGRVVLCSPAPSNASAHASVHACSRVYPFTRGHKGAPTCQNSISIPGSVAALQHALGIWTVRVAIRRAGARAVVPRSPPAPASHDTLPSSLAPSAGTHRASRTDAPSPPSPRFARCAGGSSRDAGGSRGRVAGMSMEVSVALPSSCVQACAGARARRQQPPSARAPQSHAEGSSDPATPRRRCMRAPPAAPARVPPLAGSQALAFRGPGLRGPRPRRLPSGPSRSPPAGPCAGARC